MCCHGSFVGLLELISNKHLSFASVDPQWELRFNVENGLFLSGGQRSHTSEATSLRTAGQVDLVLMCDVNKYSTPRPQRGTTLICRACDIMCGRYFLLMI